MDNIGIQQSFKLRERLGKTYIFCCFAGIFLLSVQCYILFDTQIKDDVFSEVLFFLTITIKNGSYAVNIIQFQLLLAVITVRFHIFNEFFK